MSWWVKQHIAVNDDETQQLCSIEADTQTSLPAADQTATAGFIIVRGSDALVLDTGESYIMNSAGTWIIQPAGVQLDLTGYATTQDLTDGLAGKVDTTTYTAGQSAQDAVIGAVAAMEDEDRVALVAQVDGGAKNIVNLNTNFTTHTSKGITYTNNGDGTINVSGTSNAVDSYVNLYDSNADTLFGIQKGETVVLQSTSNNVSINLIYKKQGGGYGLTVYGYKDSPAMFTIPSDFSGYVLRIGVPKKNTAVDENVGAMICTAAYYAISPAYTPYAPTNRELYEMILALQNP